MAASEFSVLRVPIDGEWRTYEWVELLEGIDELFSDFALIEIANQLSTELAIPNSDRSTLNRRIERLFEVIISKDENSTRFLEQDEFYVEAKYGISRPPALRMVAAKYGSKGGFDFLGLGGAIEAVCSLMEKCIDYFGESEERRAKRLENIREQIKLAKEANMSEEQIQELTLRLLAKSDRTFRKFIESKRVEKPPKALPAPADWEKRQIP